MIDSTPDITLVGNGSEVSLLCKVADSLKEEGITANVVSVPSIGLFLNQDREYQNSVIPEGIKIFGLTAGLPSTLYPLMKGDWHVYGLQRFGASAPYKVLDEKFGYTPENILTQIKHFLQ